MELLSALSALSQKCSVRDNAHKLVSHEPIMEVCEFWDLLAKNQIFSEGAQYEFKVITIWFLIILCIANYGKGALLTRLNLSRD